MTFFKKCCRDSKPRFGRGGWALGGRGGESDVQSIKECYGVGPS